MEKFTNYGIQARCEKIGLDIVRKSCSVWTNRLYRMTQNDGNYLRE